jgi:hypothetical protein
MFIESSSNPTIRTYEVVALQVPIVFNKYGYHDHDGMIYVLKEHEAEIKCFIKKYRDRDKYPDYEYRTKPHPLVRPLVLRARQGETVRVKLRNEISSGNGIQERKFLIFKENSLSQSSELENFSCDLTVVFPILRESIFTGSFPDKISIVELLFSDCKLTLTTNNNASVNTVKTNIICFFIVISF